MKYTLAAVLFIDMCCNIAQAQTMLNFSSGVVFSKSSSDQNHPSSIFKNSGGSSWGANATIEIPFSKKIIFQTAVEFINKKSTASNPFSSFAGLQRTERCTYLGINPSLHYAFLSNKNFKLTAGAGFFAGIATGGKYSETDANGVAAPPPYKTNATIKFGKTVNESYRRGDAGCSFQIIGRYKRFILPVIADFSFTNNIPNQSATDPYRMPVVITATRKWQSLYTGIGYSIPLNKHK